MKRPKAADREWLLIEAVKQIKEMCYNSSTVMATKTVLACIRVTERVLDEIRRPTK